jgi:HNH endonuclease
MDCSIPLTQGKVALIDEADKRLIDSHRWYANKSPSGYYALCSVYRPDGVQTKLSMHRLIMGIPDGLRVDHINGDTLDNRRANLRLATRGQNRVNGKCPRDSRSQLKGVQARVNAGRLRYRVRLRIDGRLCHIGYFDTPEEAARAWDEMARTVHGPYARCNNV